MRTVITIASQRAPGGTKPQPRPVFCIVTVRHRIVLVLSVALTALAVPFAAGIGVAQACACGVVSPAEGGTATVSHETALVGAAGDGTEDIYLSLTLDSDVRTGALLFPVPDKHATVTAGPRGLFTELAAITAPAAAAPAPPERGNGAAAPAPSVTVESRQAIGPLDVVMLSSSDGQALSSWLSQHGFTAKPWLASAAAPYIADGWAFMAVRLRPAAAAATRLDGQLDPLHLHFASSSVRYPMRLSHQAAEPQQVTIYTLARHELALHTSDPGMSRVWSGRLDAAQHPDLAGLTKGGTTFLTRYDGTLSPATITDDFHFSAVTTDSAATSSAVDTPNVLAAESSGDSHTTLIVAIVAAAAVLLIGAGLVYAQRRDPQRRSANR